ncbi:acyltransferase [Acinetobacter sp. YH01025]|uniref:acyltransferase family protein n=1 Tax=Acinetobacter sp. YH01025 TaxID=2601038 RepID=UPI0015D1165F|nr:acyltransferase [Acinetobacter sp. YH01025]
MVFKKQKLITNDRIFWIDSLRGWAILAVILGHLVNQLPWNSLAFAPFLSQEISDLLNPVRLGLILFVAGLFVNSGLKKGKDIYFKGKLHSILWPFIIWSSIYGFLKLYFSNIVNNKIEPLNLLLSTITGGQSTIWFLYTLFIFFLIIPFIRKLPIYIVIPICWYLSLISPAIPEDSIFAGIHNNRIATAFYLFPFFYLADWLVLHKKDILKESKNKIVLVISLISFLIISILATIPPSIVKTLFTLCLPLFSIPLFIFLSSISPIKPIIFIGKNSIVFYVLHQLLIQAVSKFIPEGSFIFKSSIGYISILISILLFCSAICYLRKYSFVDLFFSSKRYAKKISKIPVQKDSVIQSYKK